jgi:dihydrofolate reductase
MNQADKPREMLVSAIVAVGKNLVIGHDGRIPWYLPADLKYFKRTTLDHFVIMGRRSFESIGKPLPNRTNVVVTRDPFFIATGCLIAQSVEQALELAWDAEETEAFIIGGGEIYRQSMQFWDRIYLTEVEVETRGDTFFPAPDWEQWTLVSEEPHLPDEKNEFAWSFKVFERRVGAGA